MHRRYEQFEGNVQNDQEQKQVTQIHRGLPSRAERTGNRAQERLERNGAARFSAVLAVAAILAWAAASPGRASDALSFEPATISRIGTYARYRLDLRSAFAPAPIAAAAAEPTRADLRRLRFRFSTALDDAIRERIVATLTNDDGTRAAEFQSRFANDTFLDQATQGIRVLGLHETDLSDVTSALVIAAYNASHAVALTPEQGLGVAGEIRPVLLASAILPTLDDAAKQTIATEMSYQILFWESDASAFGYGRDPAALGRLRTSTIATMASIGLPLAQLRPTETGVELVPVLPRAADKR